jgi:hypothetical protein
MSIRPTAMASALLNAACHNTGSITSGQVIRHALTDDPKHPLKTGYNRVMLDGIRVSESTLKHIYKGK